MKTYYESAKNKMMTKERALQELQSHHISQQDYWQFLDEVGDKPYYEATEVLVWLGY